MTRLMETTWEINMSTQSDATKIAFSSVHSVDDVHGGRQPAKLSTAHRLDHRRHLHNVQH